MVKKPFFSSHLPRPFPVHTGDAAAFLYWKRCYESNLLNHLPVAGLKQNMSFPWSLGTLGEDQAVRKGSINVSILLQKIKLTVVSFFKKQSSQLEHIGTVRKMLKDQGQPDNNELQQPGGWVSFIFFLIQPGFSHWTNEDGNLMSYHWLEPL